MWRDGDYGQLFEEIRWHRLSFGTICPTLEEWASCGSDGGRSKSSRRIKLWKLPEGSEEVRGGDSKQPGRREGAAMAAMSPPGYLLGSEGVVKRLGKAGTSELKKSRGSVRADCRNRLGREGKQIAEMMAMLRSILVRFSGWLEPADDSPMGRHDRGQAGLE